MSEQPAAEVQFVQADLQDTIAMLRNDPEFFIHFFLGDELTLAVPQFHIDIFKFMISTEKHMKKFACTIPRDHAKTTLAKLAVVWYILFSPYRFVVYLSNTSPIAIAACVDIINFLTSDNCQAVFGEIEWFIKQEGTGTYKFRFEGRNKVCILRALGAGQQLRGINIDNQRPEVAIVDDLEDIENTATPHLVKKLKRWFFSTFRKAMDKLDHKIIQVGNLISNQGILWENVNSEFWASIRLGAILADGTPLWPEAWPLVKLREDFLEYKKAGMSHVWFAEMMNMPIPEGNGVIELEKIIFRPAIAPGDCAYTFITIDPSISEKETANKTAIIVHGFMIETAEWHICEYVAEVGMNPLVLIHRAIRLALKWRAGLIGAESVAYQAALQYLFKYVLVQNGLSGIEIVPLLALGSKTARIAVWCGYLQEGIYVLPEGDISIVQQLLLYDKSKKDNDDDIIDACAYGPQVIEQYLHLVKRRLAISGVPYQPALGTMAISAI